MQPSPNTKNANPKIPMETDAEIMVLSAMFLNREAAENVATIIGPDVGAFTDDRRARLYGLFLALLDEGLPFEAVVLQSEIKARHLEEVITLEFLAEIAEAAPTHHMAEFHAAIVGEAFTKRRMISALTKSLTEVYESDDNVKVLSDRAESRIFEVNDRHIAVSERTLSSHLDDMLNRGSTPQGVKTGFHILDGMTCGLQKGEMIVLAARPSVGKTALALNFAEYVTVSQKQPAAFFSLEMRTDQILMRLVSLRSGVPLHAIRSHILSADQRDSLGKAIGELRDAPLFFDDSSSLTLFDLKAKARRLVSRRGIKFLVLDYLQLMDASERAENRQQEITKISRGIKTLANELDIPILCLSQLNRASETESRRPRTSDLRESGSIEQDADVVMLLHREDVMKRGTPDYVNDNLAELILAKQRNGPCGVVPLVVIPETTCFGERYE